MVNGLVAPAAKSAFWVHVRIFEGVALVPAGWEALILGCDDKALSFCLEASCFQPFLGLVLVHISLFHPLWVFAVERFCFPIGPQLLTSLVFGLDLYSAGKGGVRLIL